MLPVISHQMSDNLHSRDRRSFAVRLSDSLRSWIREEGLKAGERVPTEKELAERYSVARATVREALKILEQEGLIDVRHGLGRFVSPTAGLMVNRPITTLESLTEMLRGLGYEPRTRVVSAKRTQPTEEEATALDLGNEDEVIRLRRFYEHEQSVLIVSNNTFDVALLDDADLDDVDFSGSFDLWLARHGAHTQTSAAQIRAENIPADLAELPEVDAADPWLTITERCLDEEGNSVLFSRDFYRGDIFTFNVLRRRGT